MTGSRQRCACAKQTSDRDHFAGVHRRRHDLRHLPEAVVKEGFFPGKKKQTVAPTDDAGCWLGATAVPSSPRAAQTWPGAQVAFLLVVILWLSLRHLHADHTLLSYC